MSYNVFWHTYAAVLLFFTYPFLLHCPTHPTLSFLVCVVQLLLGVGPALDCGTALKKTDCPSRSSYQMPLSPHQSATVGFFPHFPHPCWDLPGLSLCRSCLCLSWSLWVLTCICLIVSFKLSTTSGSSSLSGPFLHRSLSLRGCTVCYRCPIRDEHSKVSYSLHIDLLKVSGLIAIYCKE